MIKIFRQNNFEQPHEREKFRKICNMLSSQFNESKEDIYIFANVELPESTYSYIFNSEENKKTIQGSNPDMFILKNNGAVLIEIKNYPGTISWNSDDLGGKDTWTSKLFNLPSQILNEDSPNPYMQTKFNRQALIGFFQTYDSKFISKNLVGNHYNLIKGTILFTHDEVKFSENYRTLLDIPSGSWDHNISVSSLLKDNDSAYFPEFIEDNIVTPSRGYIKAKDRKKATQDELDAVNLPKIAFDLESIEKIVKLLKCKDVTSKYIGDFNEEVLEDLTIPTGLGFAPTLVHERDESIEVLDKIPKPSKEILSLPVPLKTLLYFKQSILDESKNLSMDLFIGTRNAHKNIFLLRSMYDTIFSKNKSFSVAEDVIQDIGINLKEEDPSLSYGLGLHVDSKIWMGKTIYTVEPLFSTSVIFEKGSYRPSLENELTINDSVLRKLPNFNNITRDEYFEKKDKIMQEYYLKSSEHIIRAIYNEAKIDRAKDFDPFRIYALDTRNPQRGFKPNTAAIYLSQSNFYKRLISELDLIYNDWKMKFDNGEKINDLAFNFLNSFENYQNFDKSNYKWSPPLLNILDSNYEQSKAVGFATNMDIPISVVSGPPGTGKSQFSINTIAEMNFKDKSVIFSSKNGNAVDVVSDKMNKIAPKSINRLNKIGKNVEYDKFEYSPLKVEERQRLKILLNNNTSLLNKIKNKIEEFERAVLEIDNVENEINYILMENSKLNLINWFSEDSSILNIEFWKSRLTASEESKKKGFLSRVIEVLTNEDDNLSFFDIINQESFIAKNKAIIINELNNNLPDEIVFKIQEEEDLLSFSKKYLFLIEKLDVLSKKLKKYINIIERNGNNKFYDEWSDITRENTKSALSLYSDKLNSINKSFENKSITTLSVGKDVENTSGIFDLAIFDEASQTDIISAIPIIYRAKKILVIGDEKQLNPIISVRNDKDIINWHAYNLPYENFDKYSYTSNSLLSTSDKILKSYNVTRIILKEHYRCHPDIINFSNRFFYDNILRIKTKSSTSGIEFIGHNGDCQKPPNNRSWINEEEILLVINKVLDLKKSLSCKEIGVVTPFKAQALEIKNRISKLDSFTEKDILSLTIDTAHKFQGDEKEVMIYSLTAGPSMTEKSYSWMSGGNASNPHERNLINVAVTRARSKLFIIGNENFISSQSSLLTELINWTYFCNREIKKS